MRRKFELLGLIIYRDVWLSIEIKQISGYTRRFGRYTNDINRNKRRGGRGVIKTFSPLDRRNF